MTRAAGRDPEGVLGGTAKGTTCGAHESSASPITFARAWAAATGNTSYVGLTSEEVLDLLSDLTSSLARAIDSTPVDTALARDVGTRLVAMHFTEPETLAASLRVMGTRFLTDMCLPDDSARRARLAEVCGQVAAGYSRALRNRTMNEQEAISQAALRARDSAEAALRVSESRFRAIFADAGVGMVIMDPQGVLVDVNAALAGMLGYSLTELRGQSGLDFVAESTEEVRSALAGQRASGTRSLYRRYRRLRRSNGEVRWVHLTVSLVRDESGAPAYQLGVLEDVTDRLRLQEDMRQQALHDSLTGLANRSHVAEWLADFFGESDESLEGEPGRGVGICLLDVDSFKMINDSLGHEVGDQLLVDLAGRLVDTVGSEGRLVARMGGDEFAILIIDCQGTREVGAVGEQVLAVLDMPFQIAGHELSVAASIGIIARRVTSTTATELIRDADITLGWAKADGNRMAVYDRERSAGELARFRLATTMPAALERGEFYVEYQPLVRFSTGALIGVEALVRWWHPELGRIGPDRFIGLAEETGMIVPLGHWVLQQACAQGGRWYRDFGDRAPLVSVNLAVRQAQQRGLVADVRTVLAESELPARLLQLELTESAIMTSTGEPLATLQDLAALGAKIAIDDFGTGYSNLAYLRHLPVHVLKMAGSFVEGLAGESQCDPIDSEIVSTLVALAHALGMTVTAEGVETRGQADRLRAMACDSGQGWLFARPRAPEEITRLLRSGDPLTT